MVNEYIERVNEVVKQGDGIFKKLVESGLVDALKVITSPDSYGESSVGDMPAVAVTGDDGEAKMVKILLPKHSDTTPRNTEEFVWGLDNNTNELIIHTSDDGWKRTGYIVKFVTHS